MSAGDAPVSRVRFSVLGRLEVARDGEPLVIGSAKARVLLAVLLLRPNQILSIDTLVERIWDGDGPQHARGAIHTHVARLRAALGPAGVNLRTHTLGYSLAVAEDDLDLTRFERLVAAAEGQEPSVAADLLREALGLWRGECLSDIESDVLRQDVAPLAERMITVTARRAELDLLLGRHADLTAELRRLTALHPHRESLWALFMRALYGAGRQAEALEAYRTIRRFLADELGVDPGHELQRLHQRMLRGEEAPCADSDSARRVRAAPNTLPRDLPDFTGRADHLAAITAATKSAAGATLVITAIDGMAGIGKTALAVHAAHQLATDYPHGQLYIDLHAFTAGRQPVEPFDAIGTLLVSLGIPNEQLPDDLDTRIARWRAEMNDRKAIVVLDNAATSTQLAALLPGSPASLVLVTSRLRLTGLDGTRPVSLDVLSPTDAQALFRQVTGRNRAAEPDAVAEVVALCGYLPLAIRIAAARLAHRPSWTVAALARRLRDGTRRLIELAVDDRGVAAAFAVSYDQLSESGQLVFRRIGLMPCTDLDSHGVAAIAGISLDHAETALDELVGAHLIQETQNRETTRYSFHDLLRDFARDRADTEDDEPVREAATGRIFDFYLRCLRTAGTVLQPAASAEFTIDLEWEPESTPALTTAANATSWFQAERHNLMDMARAALRLGRNYHARQFPLQLISFHYHGHYNDDELEAAQISVTAVRRIGDRRLEGRMLNNLASARHRANRFSDAVASYGEARAVLDEIGDGRGVLTVLYNSVEPLIRLGRHDEALRAGLDSLSMAKDGDNIRDLGIAHHAVAAALIKLRRFAEAEQNLRHAAEYFQESGDTWANAIVDGQLGEVHSHRGDHVKAIKLLGQCTDSLREAGDRHSVVEFINTTAECHVRAGEATEALAAFNSALDICRQMKHEYEEARALDGLASVLDGHNPVVARDHRQEAAAIHQRLGVPAAS